MKILNEKLQFTKMYDRCSRFPKLSSATPPKIGPGTYSINRTIGKDRYSYAPFLTLQCRSLSYINKAVLYQPGPDCYYPIIKQHVKGLQSMQKMAPRFAYKESDGPAPSDYQSDAIESSDDTRPTSSCSPYSGKRVCATIRNRHGIPIPSIPYFRGPANEKNAFYGYEKTLDGRLIKRVPKKIPNRIGTYISHGSMKLRRYKGVYFGNWTESRGSPLYRKEKGPGPADYDVISSKPRQKLIPYTGRRWSTIVIKKDEKGYITLGSKCNESPEISSSPKEKDSPKVLHPIEEKTCSLRYLDLLVRNAKRENIPAPNTYDLLKETHSLTPKRAVGKEKGREYEVGEEIRKKCHFARRYFKQFPPRPGFISTTPRFKGAVSETPAPGTYETPPTKFDLNVQEEPSSAAFLHRTPRFPKPKELQTPGPASYKFRGMVDEVMERLRPHPPLPLRDDKEAPGFGSKVPRVVDMTLLWSKSIPGPTHYNLQDSSRRSYGTMDAVFKSKSERFITPPYTAGKHLRRAVQQRREKSPVHQHRRSDGASLLTRSTISTRADTNITRDCESASVTATSTPIFGKRKPKKEALVFPFNSTGPRVGDFKIPDYPGPGKYDHDKAKNNAVLKSGYSGLMTTGSTRFDQKSRDWPGPTDYQRVKPEMNLKSFNASIKSDPRWDRIEEKMKKKRKNIGKKTSVLPILSSPNHCLTIVEPGKRRLVMKYSSDAILQKINTEYRAYSNLQDLARKMKRKSIFR